MITEETATQFASQWLNAWNSHNIDRILEHYDNEVEFYSPLIPLLKFNNEDVIRNKTELKMYFEIGLNAYPDLHFQLHHCFVGVNSIVIYYTSVNGRLAAEVFELNENYKAIRVLCNYTK
ncbi:MAG: nuclear transport factor 2 family protein [Verrucomicrobia bacterium]|nr:nuclear transport factor 2 family protein [Verrucomicrobiota bacterium]